MDTPAQPSPATFGHVARQASIRFSGLAFDKVLGYVFALFVAKTYGSTAFGLYIFGVGLFEISYALTEAGFERATIRAIASAQARGVTAEIPRIVRTSLAFTFPLGLAVMMVVILGAPWFSELLGRPDLALFLQLAAIAIPLSLMADNHLWAMEAIGRQRYSVIVRMVVEPIVKITIAATLFLTIEMVSRSAPLAIAYAGGVASSAVLAWMFYRREVLRDVTGTAHERHLSGLLRVAVPACGLSLLQRLLSWASIFIVFTFVTSEATTHFAVAVRTALLTMMVASAFDAAFRPSIAAALALNRQEDIAEPFQRVARTVLTIVLPAVAMLVAFPHRVMPVVGDQFAVAAPVVAVIAIGTLASFLAGPSASALTMAGHARVPFWNGLAGGAIGVIIGLGLVRRFGMLGVGIGQLVSLIVANTLHAIAAKRLLGVVSIGRGHARPIAAAIVGVAAGYLVDGLADANKYIVLAEVGAAVVLAYGATLLIVGLPPEDVKMVRAVIARIAGKGNGRGNADLAD
ncbi:MAG: oligosaccharide flippase family protein [Blastocatellia bacterium]